MANHLKVYATDDFSSKILTGIKRVSVRHSFNAPSLARITLNNTAGIRQDTVSRGDSIRMVAFPEKRTNNISYFVFYGYVSNVDVNATDYVIEATDYLGQLGNEILIENPNSIKTECDVMSTIKEIIGGSSYSISLDDVIGESRIKMSPGMDLTGMTRLSAIQSLMAQVNVTPTRFRLYGHQTKKGVGVMKLPEIEATDYTPYIAGRLPRTSAPLDFYPTRIERVEEDSDLVNYVTVRNKNLGIVQNVPPTKPAEPIHRLYDEDSLTDETQAQLFGRQILNQQGYSKMRWIVDGLPGRFDIEVGDIMQFKSAQGGLSGNQMIFNIGWEMSAGGGSSMTLEVGRQAPDLVTAIRFASSLSV